MDYFKQINELRDELHRKIIHKAILMSDPGTKYYLELDEPLEACYTIRSRETGNLECTQVILTGICGTTGELFAETAGGTSKRLYYRDLTLEQLATLLGKLDAEAITIKQNENDRHLITAS